MGKIIEGKKKMKIIRDKFTAVHLCTLSVLYLSLSKGRGTGAALKKRVQMLFQHTSKTLVSNVMLLQENKYHLGMYKQECNFQDTEINPIKPQWEYCVQFGATCFKRKRNRLGKTLMESNENYQQARQYDLWETYSSTSRRETSQWLWHF